MRNLWVDYAKGVGICLVVYGHVANGLFNARIPMDAETYTLIDNVIYSFHMPLFFFLSGLFFKASLDRRGSMQFIANKLDNIVYPYLIWSLLQGFVEVTMSRWTNGHVTPSQVLSVLWLPRAQFWFLYAMFFIMLTAVPIYRHANPRTYIWIAGASSIPMLIGAPYTAIKAIDFVMYYFIYFAVGVYFKEIEALIWRHHKKLLWPAACIAILAQYLYTFVYRMSWATRGPVEIAIALLCIFAICLCCMALSKSRYEMKWLAFLGTSSMVIYVMHTLVASGIRIVLKSFLHVQNYPMHISLGTFAGITIPLLAYHFLRPLGIERMLEPSPRFSLENLLKKKSARSPTR
ncbi:acyltransferase family protein [Oxalobacteraceae bacterium A2-2]